MVNEFKIDEKKNHGKKRVCKKVNEFNDEWNKNRKPDINTSIKPTTDWTILDENRVNFCYQWQTKGYTVFMPKNAIIDISTVLWSVATTAFNESSCKLRYFDGFFFSKKENRHERNHVHKRRKWKWMQLFFWFVLIFRQLRPLRAIISLNTVHTLFITIQLELFRQSSQCNNISFKIPYLRVWYFKWSAAFFFGGVIFFVMEMHAKIIGYVTLWSKSHRDSERNKANSRYQQPSLQWKNVSVVLFLSRT